MLTSGSLAALQELLASWIAQDRNAQGNYFTSRVPKMAVYGAFISAPLGHFLVSILQRAFAGRTSLRAKILQIIVSNLLVSPSSPCPSSPHPKHGKPPERRKRGSDHTKAIATGRPHPKHSVSSLHGPHSRRPHRPPSPRHRPRRLHARHESLLDNLSHCACLCAEVPPRADLGAVL